MRECGPHATAWHHADLASCPLLQSAAPFLPAVAKAAESSAAFEATHAGLQQYINTLNTHWYRSVAPDISATLADSLLRQDKATGLLAVNMDDSLASVLEEVGLGRGRG